MTRIYYSPDEREVIPDASETILRASLRVGIPHTHVCGGKARCSTCRVMIVEGKEARTHLLISDDTYNEVREHVRIGKTTRMMVKGKTGEHMLYEVIGLNESC